MIFSSNTRVRFIKDASNAITSQAGIDELTEHIEKIPTVSGSDIRAVLYGLPDVVPGLLQDGLSVNTSDLGYRITNIKH